jgi:hypothetical protein
MPVGAAVLGGAVAAGVVPVQLIEPIVLGPYCTYPEAVCGECSAMIGR